MMRAMRTALATLAALMAGSSTMSAQACDCPATPPPLWSAFVSAGASFLQVSSINAHLTPLGYSTLSRDATSFGVGGQFAFGELVLGAEYLSLDAGEESNPAGQAARLTARYFLLSIGREYRLHPRLRVAPALGIGRGTYAVTVSDPSTTAPTGTPTFDEVLAAPGDRSRLAGAQWVFEPMLGGELLVLRSPSDRRGIVIGAKLGYRLAFNRPDWEYRGRRASGGPVDQLDGPIVRITLGVGGR